MKSRALRRLETVGSEVITRTGAWKDSKSKKLHDRFRKVTRESEPSSREKAAMLVQEMILDTSLAMASGSASGWYNLGNSYDSEKGFFEQDAEFQHNASVVISSNIGLAMVLHGAKMTTAEFVVGRSVALRPITSVVLNPIVLAPVGMIAAAMKYPEVAGPQYQTAMTGQPAVNINVVSLAKHGTAGSRRGYSWYQLGYWRGY